MMIYMKKNDMISVRIPNSLKKIKEDLNLGWSDIIKSGIETEILRNEKMSFLLSELAQEYNEKYIQCITKIQKNKDLYIQRNTGFEGIYQLYREQGRSINNPTKQDRNWIEGRIKNIPASTVDGFIFYCKNKDGVKNDVC